MELIFESDRSFEICLEKSPKNKKGDPDSAHLKTVVLGGEKKKKTLTKFSLLKKLMKCLGKSSIPIWNRGVFPFHKCTYSWNFIPKTSLLS